MNNRVHGNGVIGVGFSLWLLSCLGGSSCSCRVQCSLVVSKCILFPEAASASKHVKLPEL